MGEQNSKEQQEAEMAQAIEALAKKHGCKVKIDFAQHLIDFDCPDKQSELDLAMEIKKLMGAEEN